MDWFLERARALGVEHRPPAPLLLGRHLLELGMTPGPRVGEVLKQVYEKQLDGEIKTVEEAIEAARPPRVAVGRVRPEALCRGGGPASVVAGCGGGGYVPKADLASVM
jgi:hypothetical protein